MNLDDHDPGDEESALFEALLIGLLFTVCGSLMVIGLAGVVIKVLKEIL